MAKVVKIYPGPGKIAIKPIPTTNEIPFNNGSTRLWIPGGGNAEGIVGRVVAVCAPYASDGGQEFEANYKVDDVVIIGKFTGTRLDVGNESLTILYEKDVLASVDMVEEELPPLLLESGNAPV